MTETGALNKVVCLQVVATLHIHVGIINARAQEVISKHNYGGGVGEVKSLESGTSINHHLPKIQQFSREIDIDFKKAQSS